MSSTLSWFGLTRPLTRGWPRARMLWWRDGGHQVRRAFRLTAGSAALLGGISCLFLLARALVTNWPPEGFKAPAYLWAFTLAGFLPASFGSNLLWRGVPWRAFAGWWLLALGAVSF